MLFLSPLLLSEVGLAVKVWRIVDVVPDMFVFIPLATAAFKGHYC